MYNRKIISLEGNRKLINAIKKAGIRTFHPQGPYNGYGYIQLPLAAEITSIGEMRKFNRIKKEIASLESTSKKVKSPEEIMEAWAKRLVKLVGEECGISLEEAREIAESKLNYKYEKINELEERQYRERYSVQREKLIKKMTRENPLRRIKDASHAMGIVAAYRRHTTTAYDIYLQEYHEEEEENGIRDGGAREYARRKVAEDKEEFQRFLDHILAKDTES